MKREYSVLEIYMSRVFKVLMIGIPMMALFAGLTYSTIKLLGFYPDVPLGGLIIFDCVCVVYFIIGLVFRSRCEDEDGNLKPKIVFYGKILIGVLEIVQWNTITYLLPSRAFWAYAIFFVLLIVFFLDHKYTALVIAGISVSMAISWVINGELLLPVRDEWYLPNMILRGVCLLLSFVMLWAVTYLVETRLVSELEMIADYDALTLLRNRRGLSEDIFAAIGEHRETNKPIAVLMCDLDDFKVVNDTYGHDCGDAVLKYVARTIEFTVASKGLVFRYGGEEILCLLHTDREKTMELAERLRRNVEDGQTVYDGNSVSVTVTVGVSVYEEGMTEEQLIKRADANLYYGKNHGKNQVVI